MLQAKEWVESSSRPGPRTVWKEALCEQSLEQREDGRRLQRAVVAAVGLHVVFLIVQLPAISAPAPAEAPPERAFVVAIERFRPPPRAPDPRLPERREVRIPWPDPTPDSPEPIEVERVDDLDLPDVDVLDFELPAEPPPLEPSGPIPVRGRVRPPERVHYPLPEYTNAARAARIQGVVSLQAVIDRDGGVTELEVIRGLPMGLTESALRTVSEWRFRPATLDGKPVAVFYTLRVTFALQ